MSVSFACLRTEYSWKFHNDGWFAIQTFWYFASRVNRAYNRGSPAKPIIHVRSGFVDHSTTPDPLSAHCLSHIVPRPRGRKALGSSNKNGLKRHVGHAVLPHGLAAGTHNHCLVRRVSLLCLSLLSASGVLEHFHSVPTVPRDLVSYLLIVEWSLLFCFPIFC